MKLHNPDSLRSVGETFSPIYSHAVETRILSSRQLFISGQVGVSASGELGDGFGGQLTQALKNVEAILESADMATSNIVKVVYYLTRPEDLEELSEIRTGLWYGIRPAVTTLIVARLAHEDWLVEVEVLAQEEQSE